jgi:hypothetical protein
VYQKKKIFNMIFALIVLSILLAFLRPRSFLKSIDTEIKSMSVVIIENSLEHEQTEYTFNVNDPEFHEIMDVLDRYPYHISLGTISNRIKDTAHIEDNKADIGWTFTCTPNRMAMAIVIRSYPAAPVN